MPLCAQRTILPRIEDYPAGNVCHPAFEAG